MRILYHHRTASKDGQAVHIEEMIDAMRALGHEVRVVAPLADQGEGQMGGGVGWVHRLKARQPHVAVGSWKGAEHPYQDRRRGAFAANFVSFVLRASAP